MTMGCGVYLWLVCVAGLLLDKGQGKNKNYSDSLQVKMVSMRSEKTHNYVLYPRLSDVFFLFFLLLSPLKQFQCSNERYLLGQNTKRVLINDIPLKLLCDWTLI